MRIAGFAVSETITDEILRAHYTGLDANYKEHQFELAREIYEREAPKIVFWESQRVMDMVMGYLVQWESDGLRSPELMEWLGRFRDDKDATVKAYWKAIYNGIKSAFKDGAGAIPDVLTPGQQKKQQEA
jgi:hypothetical protein